MHVKEPELEAEVSEDLHIAVVGVGVVGVGQVVRGVYHGEEGPDDVFPTGVVVLVGLHGVHVVLAEHGGNVCMHP